MTLRKSKRSVGRRPSREGGDGDTKTDIIAAGRRVFAAKGYDGTSVREIAEAAHVNKAMIYYHFRDKRELYRAVLSYSLDSMQRIWHHSVFSGNASARLKIQTYVEGFVHFHYNNEELRKILTMEYSVTGAKSENLQWIAKRYFAKDHAALVKILRQGMRSGELRKADPLMAVVMLIGMIIHSFLFVPMCPFVHGKKITLSVSTLSKFATTMFFDGIGDPAVSQSPRGK